MSELEDMVMRLVGAALKRQSLSIELVHDIEIDEHGIGKGQGLGGEIAFETARTSAFRSRPQGAASSGIVLKLGGEGNSAFLLAWTNFEAQQIKTLDEGASVMESESGAKLVFDQNGAVSMDAADGQVLKLQGGGKGIARKDDQVKVTIPTGAVIIAVAGGVGTSNAAPIELMGTIISASTKGECG